MSFSTTQIHAGQQPDPTTLAVAAPIYASTAFTYKDQQHIEDIAQRKVKAYLYSRLANPTATVFEERISKLEEGHSAVATASGQSATLLALLALAKAGDNFVVSAKLYGGTFHQFNHFLPRIGIKTKWVPGTDVSNFEAAIDADTKGIFLESITNPRLELLDLEALAAVAHRNNIPLIVDNTFGCGGYLIKPIVHGADIVVHSATKWIGGHGATLGGAVVSSGKFNFLDNPRFPEFNTELVGYPGLFLAQEFGPAAYSAKLRLETLRDMGPTLSPFASFLLLQGLETLSLRVDKHTSNALKLATWLQQHQAVKWVAHPGLESHPSFTLAKKYLPRGTGGMLAFALKGATKSSEQLAPEFIDATKLAIHAPNVGDVRTLVVRCSHTTHRQLTKKELEINGTTPELIRVSVGLEDIEDIIADFEQAIEAALKY
ncbi:O-acetylhomoserine ami [Meredithblackwellia eburnea MCA 4105]